MRLVNEIFVERDLRAGPICCAQLLSRPSQRLERAGRERSRKLAAWQATDHGSGTPSQTSFSRAIAYSDLNTTSGSAFIDRRAGISAANAATKSKSNVAANRICGLSGDTS
jgi:hypothetical protein